jgi:hypothetical protein
LDTQHPARERVSAEAGESTCHHWPKQWHLSGPSTWPQRLKSYQEQAAATCTGVFRPREGQC